MLDKFLQPEETPATSERPQIGYDFDSKSDRGMVKAFQLKGGVVDTSQIADGAITTDKIAQLAVNTGDIANAAVTSVKLSGSMDGKIFTNGTVGTATLGTCSIVAGNMGTTMVRGGTIGTALIGTCNIVHGTINANVYQTGGTAGFSGSIGYLNAGTVKGTMTFNNGLLIGTI